MFDVDIRGLRELEGGRAPHRLAIEPIANVFDEFRGYEAGRKRPTFCGVQLTHSKNPRGVRLTVTDDGAGFTKESDIWTFFGSTAKRSAAGVSGRFNAGDKQLIAVAREAVVKTNNLTVTFADGKRDITRHRKEVHNGTVVEALMPWNRQELQEVREQLRQVIPPDGLRYIVDGEEVVPPPRKHQIHGKLETVKLVDGVLRKTTRKTAVNIHEASVPMLHELGIPVCSLGELGFPWSLDVQQKVPVPISRDGVTPAYVFRLVGTVLEQAAMDGVRLLTEDEEGAPFVKQALHWVKDEVALKAVITDLYGGDAVRRSSDTLANAQAEAAGAKIVDGRWFTEETRRRMDKDLLPTSKRKFGGVASISDDQQKHKCPNCNGKGYVQSPPSD